MLIKHTLPQNRFFTFLALRLSEMKVKFLFVAVLRNVIPNAF